MHRKNCRRLVSRRPFKGETMLKRGVITDEISQDIEKAASLAKQYGLTGLEIRSVWEKGPHEL